MSETTLDRLISKGLVDAYACHKACGEYWTQCECHEVWVESQGGIEALVEAEESAKREYLDNSVGHCVDCDDYHEVDLPCEGEDDSKSCGCEGYCEPSDHDTNEYGATSAGLGKLLFG